MATIFSWETGSLPTTVGGVSVDTGTGYPSASSIKFDQVSTEAALCRWSFSAVDEIALRLYYKTPSSWPSGANSVAVFRVGGSTQVCWASISGTGQPGQLRLYRTGGNQVAASSNNTLSVDTWYRIEMLLNTTTGQARVAAFPLTSDTAVYDSGWQTHSDFEVEPTRVEIGSIGTSPTVGTFWMDTILCVDDASGLIGRDAGDVGEEALETPGDWTFEADPGPNVVRIEGEWTEVDGADSYEVEVQRWNGSSWEAFGIYPVEEPPFALDAVDGLTEGTTYRGRIRALPPEE